MDYRASSVAMVVFRLIDVVRDHNEELWTLGIEDFLTERLDFLKGGHDGHHYVVTFLTMISKLLFSNASKHDKYERLREFINYNFH